ncbi:uncharacterized protein LOC115888399 isoform X2 [Sitophilus oryzae]|uniref:Uncharacterized protein LOC115888399 isoform X2 n=1 Tax=Sitophilus oryzae TaxID=7048 RepID=A0A6J2YIW5_SITOR|nr:uncharacterized protein LOC115888399 isoform X2 [Sitophilus oryzae]
MPNKTGLKLFTKTWPLRRNKKVEDEDRQRPLTATLDKPAILDIRFIDKIDMSTIRKEFLNITNLCRMPLVIRKKEIHRPLSLISPEMYNRTRRKRRKADSTNESNDDTENDVTKSAKTTNITSRYRSKSSSKLKALKSPKYSDANNNNQILRPSKKPILSTIKQRETTVAPPALASNPTKSPSASIKLMPPCKTCGRPDLPERFHSHPTTPLKSKKPQQDPAEVQKIIPVKSSVQKPIAIKYVSRTTASSRQKILPIKRPSVGSTGATSLPLPSPLSPTTVIGTTKINPGQGNLTDDNKKNLCESITETRERSAMKGSAGKRTLTCYICGREFGTASLHLHEPKCLEKWERENAALPLNMRRKAPVKPDSALSPRNFNQLAWEASQSTLVPCKNCGRTFYPDRLMVHQRSCRTPINTLNKKSSTTSSNMSVNTSSSSPESSSSSKSAKSNQPPAVECYICGKMFGTHSIKIHEKQCLKKWHVENESLPHDMRSPAPLKTAKKQSSVSSISSSTPEQPKTPKTPASSSKDERPTSGAKSPLFPCYLCGKLFTVNSIYIHEPQCLKMWKIENDKLPASKRRPVPMKPDIKFTRTVFSLAFFSRFLKLHDSLLGIISCSTKIMAAGIYAFAPTPFYFYMAAVVELLNGTSFIAMRAMISKLVLPEELGKINSLFGIGEAIVPLIYGPLYSRIYGRTIDVLPGCFYLVGGGLTVPAVFIFLWLYMEHKKDLKEESKQEAAHKIRLLQDITETKTNVKSEADKALMSIEK